MVVEEEEEVVLVTSAFTGCESHSEAQNQGSMVCDGEEFVIPFIDRIGFGVLFYLYYMFLGSRNGGVCVCIHMHVCQG